MTFKELGEYQKKLHEQEDYLSLFIKLEAVWDNEVPRIWDWLMENSLDVDRNGKLRRKLMHRLDPAFVRDSLASRPGGRPRVVPDKLKSHIEDYITNTKI